LGEKKSALFTKDITRGAFGWKGYCFGGNSDCQAWGWEGVSEQGKEPDHFKEGRGGRVSRQIETKSRSTERFRGVCVSLTTVKGIQEGKGGGTRKAVKGGKKIEESIGEVLNLSLLAKSGGFNYSKKTVGVWGLRQQGRGEDAGGEKGRGL